MWSDIQDLISEIKRLDKEIQKLKLFDVPKKSELGGGGGGSGTPATTVTDETTWGIAPAVGSDTEYARQDHTHGSPADPGAGGDTVSEGPGIDIVAGASKAIGLGGDTILLFNCDGSPVEEFPATTIGLNSAIAAADSGDIIQLPATTITLPSGDTIYSVGAEVSTGQIPVNVSTTTTIPGLTIGNLYAIEATDGPWYFSSSFALWAYIYRVCMAGVWSALVGRTFGGLHDIPPAWADFMEAVDANIFRIYFTAAENHIEISILDSVYLDNHGTWNWKLSDASKTADEILEIPSGVEVIGLGENSILDGDLTNNGILTNLKVTGSITGSGALRMVANPTAQKFSDPVAITLPDGTSPLQLESQTLVENLNADMLDGRHFAEIAVAGQPGLNVYLNSNFS